MRFSSDEGVKEGLYDLYDQRTLTSHLTDRMTDIALVKTASNIIFLISSNTVPQFCVQTVTVTISIKLSSINTVIDSCELACLCRVGFVLVTLA